MDWRVVSVLLVAGIVVLTGLACSRREPPAEQPKVDPQPEPTDSPKPLPRPAIDDLSDDIDRILSVTEKNLLKGLQPVVGAIDLKALQTLDAALTKERDDPTKKDRPDDDDQDPSGVLFRLDRPSLRMTEPSKAACSFRRSGRGMFTIVAGPKILIARGRHTPPLNPEGPQLIGMPTDPTMWLGIFKDPVELSKIRVRRAPDEEQSFLDYSMLSVVDYSRPTASPKHPDQAAATITPGEDGLHFLEMEIREKPIECTFETSADGRRVTRLTLLDGKDLTRYFREATVGHSPTK